MINVVISQFGTVFVSEAYKRQGLSSQDAQDHLGWLSLIGNLTSLLVVMTTGYLSTRVAIWKLLTFTNLLGMCAFSMIVFDIEVYQGDKITHVYDLGVILSSCSMFPSEILCFTMMAKLCSQETRGTMFFFGGMIGSLSNLFI